MSIRTSLVAVLLALCTACAADSPNSEKKPDAAAAPAASASAPAVQKYDMKGKVLSIDKPGKMMTVDHEAIPNFMGAMAMPYAVHDEHALETVAAGDQITAKVVSSGSGYWLEEVVVAQKAP
jgi:Cu/Ag efflux protein CusF